MAKENKTTFRKNFERFLKSKDWETDEIKITDKIKCALIKKCKKEFCLYANYTDEEYEKFFLKVVLFSFAIYSSSLHISGISGIL